MISILVALTVPAISSISNSSAVTQSGNRLVDLASLARSSALSRNKVTALVGVKGSDELAGRAFTVLEIGSDRQWKQLTGWSILSEHVSVKDNGSAPYTQLPSQGSLDLKLRGQSKSGSDLTAMIFYPDGRTMGDPNALRTFRVEPFAAGSNYYDIVFNADSSNFRIVRP